MGCVVGLKCVKTGEIRRIVNAEDNWGEELQFLWEDGNYACDCNREQFYREAAGETGDESPCGDSRFTVEYVEARGIVISATELGFS